MKDTHPQVKFDVFERLNTGAVELAAQELRHGLYHGRFVEWVGQAAKDQRWRDLVRAGNNKRMKAEEFLVRFLAFHTRLEHYEKPLASFLNLFTEQHRDASEDVLVEFESIFDLTTEVVATVFGDLAFSIFDSHASNKIVSPFNAALFDAEMVAISRATLSPKQISNAKRKAFLAELGEMFYQEDFEQSIARATSDPDRIKTRIHKMQRLVARHF
jgi:hypothetical protein